MAACAGANPYLAKYKESGLGETNFNIVGGSSASQLTQLTIHDFNGLEVDEAERFEQTIKSLKSSGFLDSEITSILDVIVGILFLGNIQFEENQDTEHCASIQNTEIVSKAATYLRVPE